MRRVHIGGKIVLADSPHSGLALYQQIIQRVDLTKILNEFYQLIETDGHLNRLYPGLRLLRPQHSLYLIQIMGGPVRDGDLQVAAAHHRIGIPVDLFDAAGAHLRSALLKAGLTGEETEAVLTSVRFNT